MAGRRRAGPERGPKARLKESFMPLPALRAAWPFLRYVCAEKRPRHGCGPIKQYNNVFGKRHEKSCRFSVHNVIEQIGGEYADIVVADRWQNKGCCQQGQNHL